MRLDTFSKSSLVFYRIYFSFLMYKPGDNEISVSQSFDGTSKNHGIERWAWKGWYLADKVFTNESCMFSIMIISCVHHWEKNFVSENTTFCNLDEETYHRSLVTIILSTMCFNHIGMFAENLPRMGAKGACLQNLK